MIEMVICHFHGQIPQPGEYPLLVLFSPFSPFSRLLPASVVSAVLAPDTNQHVFVQDDQMR